MMGYRYVHRTLLARSQSASTGSPIVSRTVARSGVATAVGTTTRSRIAKATHSLSGLRLVGIGWWLVLVQAKVINQESWSLQDILSVYHRNNIRHEIVQVSQGHAVQHGLVRISTDDSNCQIGEWKVQSLNRETPEEEKSTRNERQNEATRFNLAKNEHNCEFDARARLHPIPYHMLELFVGCFLLQTYKT